MRLVVAIEKAGDRGCLCMRKVGYSDVGLCIRQSQMLFEAFSQLPCVKRAYASSFEPPSYRCVWLRVANPEKEKTGKVGIKLSPFQNVCKTLQKKCIDRFVFHFHTVPTLCTKSSLLSERFPKSKVYMHDS